jgi:hypothetical protein
MASVTATIVIQSPNITNDVLSLNVSYNLTTDGSNGVSELVGISRRSGVDSRTVLFAAADYANGGVVYIKNLDTVFANGVLVEVGTPSPGDILEVGVLNGGEAYLMPWNADEDFSVTADDSGTVIEYALFVK